MSSPVWIKRIQHEWISTRTRLDTTAGILRARSTSLLRSHLRWERYTHSQSERDFSEPYVMGEPSGTSLGQ